MSYCDIYALLPVIIQTLTCSIFAREQVVPAQIAARMGVSYYLKSNQGMPQHTKNEKNVVLDLCVESVSRMGVLVDPGDLKKKRLLTLCKSGVGVVNGLAIARARSADTMRPGHVRWCDSRGTLLNWRFIEEIDTCTIVISLYCSVILLSYCSIGMHDIWEHKTRQLLVQSALLNWSRTHRSCATLRAGSWRRQRS